MKDTMAKKNKQRVINIVWWKLLVAALGFIIGLILVLMFAPRMGG